MGATTSPAFAITATPTPLWTASGGCATSFDEVLKTYGYGNGVHPEKLWICTEFNMPRKEYGEYIGSEDAQINFLIKPW